MQPDASTNCDSYGDVINVMSLFPVSRNYARFGLLVLGIAMAAVTANCKGCTARRQPFGGRLPASARDIQEQEIDLFPDWEYYFRANIPSGDCEAFLAKLAHDEHLKPISEHQWDDGKGDWSPSDPPIWWKPSWTGVHHHGREGDINTCAMCEGGAFYYWSGSH